MHNKRQSMPKNWPIARKGNTYYVNSSHSPRNGIPVVIVLRDILEIVETYKEAKLMCMNKEVKINEITRRDETFPLRVFDILSLDKIKKTYRVEVIGKKIKLAEISAKETSKKVVKIIGKKILPKKVVQMNLDDGSNFLVKEKFAVGDSAVLNLKENKVEKILALKEGAKVFVVSGKHSGKQGKITELKFSEKRKECLIKFDEGESVLRQETLLVVE